MVVYKIIDEFSRKTGEKIGVRKMFDFLICDFTGERIDEYSNPNTYNINYQNNDPNFGANEGEKWLYKFDEEADVWGLFAQGDYIFKIDERKVEVFGKMIETALSEGIEIYSLDHLLRWSRGRMLEKVLKKGIYKLEDFFEESWKEN